MKLREDDIGHMRHALRLATRALGHVAPNPAVGCVIVSGDGRIIGRGQTQAGGRPHAETVALSQAGSLARGATAYVTLEPCAHHGLTPPCTDALVAAGLARVVGAAVDPDARVSGSGFARLQSAGIIVTRGVLAAEARALNLGFFRRVADGRPMVALKIAQSADGYVADAKGNSRWITSEDARRHGHLLRARHDAILVGIGTVLADDPELTCRLPGLEHCSPLRIVLDSHLRTPVTSKLVLTARDHQTIIFTVAKIGGEALAAQGVSIERVKADEAGRPDIAAVLQVLGRSGLTRLLVEGGPAVHASFLGRGLVDMIHIYRAPPLIGAGGLPAIVTANPAELSTAARLKLLERLAFGPDILESFALTV
jgi:diaminohydroxyphosphoribosylaminopyrimidine deaminase/5-amino-6-(5-phosphoribosylamino)uracil reductase